MFFFRMCLCLVLTCLSFLRNSVLCCTSKGLLFRASATLYTFFVLIVLSPFSCRYYISFEFTALHCLRTLLGGPFSVELSNALNTRFLRLCLCLFMTCLCFLPHAYLGFGATVLFLFKNWNLHSRSLLEDA